MAAGGGLDISIEHDGKWVRIALTGVFDGASLQKFDGAIVYAVDSEHCHVILDLRKLTYMSSAGAGAIINLFSKVADFEGKLTIIKPPEPVQSVFEIVGLTSMLNFVDTPDEIK